MMRLYHRQYEKIQVIDREQEACEPAQPARSESPRRARGARMKWVTRARPKIDRIACPWLVARFIDPSAEFLYVAADQVLAVATRTGAIPYDIPDVELSH